MMKALFLAPVTLMALSSFSAGAALFDSIESIDVLKQAHPTAGRAPAGEAKTPGEGDTKESKPDGEAEKTDAASPKKN